MYKGINITASIPLSQPSNSFFVITDFTFDRPSLDELVVYIGERGTYTVRIDKYQQVLALISPISGHHKYFSDPEEGLWLGTADRHDLRGLITRDLLRHAIGFPQFPNACRKE